MKKLNRSILRKINYCIGFILSIFGLTTFMSCEYGCPPVTAEYGVPQADYLISGRVENAQKKGIQGIKVYMRTAEAYEYNMFEGNPTAADTTTTDGVFEINCTEFPEREIWLVAEDIDSTENGSYKRDSVLITPEFKDVAGSNWRHTAVVNDVVITLEEEKEQPLN